MIIYPAIDILDGRVVRLLHGRFDQVTVYADDPVAVAAEFASEGATHLHVVDLEGSKLGSRRAASLIGRLAHATGLKVQVGGGIRDRDAAAAYLDQGVDRVVLGSLAATDPKAALALAAAFGADRITLALDLKIDPSGKGRVATWGWTKEAEIGPEALLTALLGGGLRRVLVTDVGRDGALTGPNLALYRGLLGLRLGGLELLASGGVADLGDLSELGRAGVHGAIVGRALYEQRFTLREALTQSC